MHGVRLAWKVLKSEAMRGAYQRVAGLNDEIVGSDERLKKYMRANIGTYCRALGTAPSDRLETGKPYWIIGAGFAAWTIFTLSMHRCSRPFRVPYPTSRS